MNFLSIPLFGSFSLPHRRVIRGVLIDSGVFQFPYLGVSLCLLGRALGLWLPPHWPFQFPYLGVSLCLRLKVNPTYYNNKFSLSIPLFGSFSLLPITIANGTDGFVYIVFQFPCLGVSLCLHFKLASIITKSIHFQFPCLGVSLCLSRNWQKYRG